MLLEAIIAKALSLAKLGEEVRINTLAEIARNGAELTLRTQAFRALQEICKRG